MGQPFARSADLVCWLGGRNNNLPCPSLPSSHLPVPFYRCCYRGLNLDANTIEYVVLVGLQHHWSVVFSGSREGVARILEPLYNPCSRDQGLNSLLTWNWIQGW